MQKTNAVAFLGVKLDCNLVAGITKIYDVPSDLTQYEQDAIAGSKAELKASIQKGVDFANSNS